MVRSRLLEQLELEEKYVPVLVHPSAVVAEDIQLGTGTVVAAGAVINPGARIGKGCIINTCSSVDMIASLRTMYMFPWEPMWQEQSRLDTILG